MLKLRIALCLALLVGILTLTNGMYYGARAVTILYRVVISIVVFGFIGYGLGIAIENLLEQFSEKDASEEQEHAIVSEQQATDDASSEPVFSPFTSDNFEQISRPKE